MHSTEKYNHVYDRKVGEHGNDSLSLIAQLIEPGAVVLDLGMGTGGLGSYLSQRQTITIDGVTLNPNEARCSSHIYRQIEVADLETSNLSQIFGGRTYDYIVCADVLEHLKNPEWILKQCQELIKPEGQLLTSVPNIAYSGLLCELLLGEFKYRTEGLLDSTHLRFFTRKSLLRFFELNGWHVRDIQTVTRDILNSEFAGEFNHLPPAVSRYLLSKPDASTYQFISSLVPIQSIKASSAAPPQIHLPARPLFSAQLYLAVDGQYSETVKLVQAGTMGGDIQILQFDIDSMRQGQYTSLRLDPADRPGFLRLMSIQLYASEISQPIWDWQADSTPRNILENASQQQISWSPSWGPTGQIWLQLLADDPWIELPIDPATLQSLTQNGGHLKLVCSWPMSADYLQANQQLQTQLATINKLQTELYNIQNATSSLTTTPDEVVQDKNTPSQRNASSPSDKPATPRLKHEYLRQVKKIQRFTSSVKNSQLFRWAHPLTNFKYSLHNLFKPNSLKTNSQPLLAGLPRPHLKATLPLPKAPVDIIVPVYRGLEDTQRSIQSALSSDCKIDWHMVIINDCSPEPEIGQWLRELASKESRVTLLENEKNLGFVATVNKGMRLHADRDVLLLNSDAEVANDWLDRMQRAAYGQPQVASVTPFSNNATICSYPNFCQPNELPAGHTTSSLDRLCSKYLTGYSVQVPTGVGFCMYIRRECLNQIGYFDEEHFGKGYGEENDFCSRAHQAGWINLHLLDTFVRHVGGISFGESKGERELTAMRTMAKLHPSYESDVHQFIARDPALWARCMLDLARITDSNKPVILNVVHNREGGTIRHLQEMGEHLANIATFLRLSPIPGGVELRLEGRREHFAMFFSLPGDKSQLVAWLKRLQVAHVHFHHLLGHTPFATEIPKLLNVAYDFTVHDYYSFCPQISLTDETHSYCGEKGIDACRQCLKRNPAPEATTIESWHSLYVPLLEQARAVICPSADTAERIIKFVPKARLHVVPHNRLQIKPTTYPQPNPSQLASTQPLKIVVLGALSQIKGADVVEAVGLLAAKQQLPIDIHLLGFPYRKLKTQPGVKLTVHGPYEEKDLSELLDWLQPDVAWFPALWPETYSYTLSACLEKGLPIIAPSLGAFSERLVQRTWTWVCPWNQSPKQWVDFFVHVRANNFLTGASPLFCPPPVFSRPMDHTFSYHGNYLNDLVPPAPLHPSELIQMTTDIFQSGRFNTNPNQSKKNFILPILQRLKGTRFFSPLVKRIPSSLQRRVKSWLLR